jgi:hypothetical protein
LKVVLHIGNLGLEWSQRVVLAAATSENAEKQNRDARSHYEKLGFH